MVVEGRNRTAVFTDQIAPEIDQAQYDSGEGPCLDAVLGAARHRRSNPPSEPGKWPEFREVAAAPRHLEHLVVAAHR